MIIYHYNADTGEYLGSSEAKINLLESQRQGKDVYRLPANATFDEPPVAQEGFARCYLNEQWTQVEDHRGEIVYNKTTARAYTVYDIGTIHEDYTLLAPDFFPKWDGTKWAVDTDAAKNAKLVELAVYRHVRETAGITVNGAIIRTDLESQAMINGAVAYVNLNPTAMIDWKAANGWVQIDKDTIIAIGVAVGAHVQACYSRERVHAEAIAALTTPQEIMAYDITTGWPE